MGFFGHLKTVLTHKKQVFLLCKKAGILRHGITHDLSKFSPVEFLAGVRYFQGNRSPNDAERKAKGYSAAWLHHKGRNKHHLEYWIDYSAEGDRHLTGIRMPERYVVEMVCDRIAASKTYRKELYTDSDPYNYYEYSRAAYLMHPESQALLEQLLILLKEEGEEAMFGYIKREVLRKRWKKSMKRH